MRHRHDPEYRPGWRDTWTIEGIEVDVVARHITRERFPRGHELVHQVARYGRIHHMTEETEHEWAVLVGHGHLGVIRQNHAGAFTMGNLFLGRDDLRAAVEEAVKVHLPRLRPDRAATLDVAPDAPDTDSPPGMRR